MMLSILLWETIIRTSLRRNNVYACSLALVSDQSIAVGLLYHRQKVHVFDRTK